MAPSPLQQRRTHNTLLFQKLLNLREHGTSPFTLVLDSLEQSGGPLIREFARRGKISKNQIVFISFSTLRKKIPFEIDNFVSARGKALATLRTEILELLKSPFSAPADPFNNKKSLLIIDTLFPLCANHASHISTFLSSLLISPTVSLLATYHTDIPLPSSPSTSTYLPPPLTTLAYVATSILTLSSLSEVLAQKRARDKSLQEPVFGLSERKEGVLVGLKGNGKDEGKDVVVRMELRRKSGRGIVENFVLSPPEPDINNNASSPKLPPVGEFILLDDHPLYASPPSGIGNEGGGEGEIESTFNLGLTEKQRRDREGVVLPYFDAQNDSGVGEGGRILYEMGVEDREDFDDEEDEI